MNNRAVNVTWSRGMAFGRGVNLLDGAGAGFGVDPGEVGETSAARVVDYGIKVANGLEDLYSSVGLSADGVFGDEGKAGFVKQVSFNSYSTFLIARRAVESSFRHCRSATLGADAWNLLEKGESEIFRRRYGDGYVRGVRIGGEFVAIIEISDDELTATTYQRGGRGGQPVSDVDSMLVRLREFPSLVAENQVPYEAEVAAYETLSRPAGCALVDIAVRRRMLDEYARLTMRLMSLRGDVEFVQLNPELFADPPDLLTLNEWQLHIAGEITKVSRQASACADRADTECPELALNLPEGYRMPERKVPVELRAALLAVLPPAGGDKAPGACRLPTM